MEICTRDMYLAAILMSYDCPIIGVDKSDTKRQYFQFNQLPAQVYTSNADGTPILMRVDSFEDLKALFLSKKLFLLPSFVDCLRSVKSYIYSSE